MFIYRKEGRAFPLKILQCCLGDALGGVESRLRLARLADGQLQVNVSVNAF